MTSILTSGSDLSKRPPFRTSHRHPSHLPPAFFTSEHHAGYPSDPTFPLNKNTITHIFAATFTMPHSTDWSPPAPDTDSPTLAREGQHSAAANAITTTTPAAIPTFVPLARPILAVAPTPEDAPVFAHTFPAAHVPAIAAAAAPTRTTRTTMTVSPLPPSPPPTMTFSRRPVPVIGRSPGPGKSIISELLREQRQREQPRSPDSPQHPEQST
ncbi:hypothetical protein N657DRAFT_645074 [Parathielavia appendiculata]|uniref:Uncharacterized protein n=1 Tax=Parathielavia appendiculata TaxID=2587402 RepID=A0AAN6Z342_9PEZI|nr:hypothetical protein N657DRAFT_645074 [Parathielavia appendiculata]